MRRGLAALESLEEEFQDAMHAAYHGPEVRGPPPPRRPLSRTH